MVVEDSPESLPEGWTLEFNVLKTGRKVKHYMNSGTGQEFFSEDDFMHYIKEKSPQLDQPHPTKSPIIGPSKNNQMHASIRVIEYTDERPKWLPHGWIMELKTRISGSSKGKLYKCYVDTSTGHKCYSKPEVFRYLKTVKQKSSTSMQKEMLATVVPTNEVTTEKPTAEDLPSELIEEMKITGSTNGTRKDQPSSADKRQKLEHPITRSPLLGVNGSSDVTSMASLDADSLWKREGETTVSSLTTLPVASSIETSSQKSSKDGSSESNENSNMNWSGPTKAEDLEDHQDKKVSTDGGPGALFFEADDRQEQNSVLSGVKSEESYGKKAQNKLRESNYKKGVNLSHRFSKRLAGIEPDTVINSVSTMRVGSEAVKKQGLKTGSGIKGVGIFKMETQSSSRNFNNKKGHRYSKRLAGFGPEPVANSGVHALPKTIRSAKGEAAPAVGLNNCVLADETFEQNQSESRKELLPHTSYDVNYLLLGIEPEQVANSVSIVQALPKTIRPAKGETALALGLNNSVLAAEAFKQTQSEPRKELLLQTFCDADNLLFGADPESAGTSVFIVQALPKTIRPAKGKTALVVGLNNGVLAAEASKQTQPEPRKELLLQSSCDANNLLLAVEPESAADSVSIVHDALSKTMRPAEGKTALAVGFNNGVLAAEASKQTQPEPRKELLLHDSCNTNYLSFGEPANESQSSDKVWPVLTEAKVSEGSIVKIVNTDNVPVLTPEADTNQEQNCPAKGKKLRTRGKSEKNLRASSTKRRVNFTRRSSRRLAGLGIELVANSVSRLKKSEVSCENESIIATGLIPSALVDETTKQIGADLCQSLSNVKNSLHGELSNENQMLHHTDDVSKDKSEILEVGITNDNQSESDIIPPFGEFLSDPCLEFAYKTLTGELPVEITPDSGLVSTPVADVVDEGNLTMKKIDKSCYGKAQGSSRKLKTSKMRSLFHQAFEFEPEPVASSVTKNSAFKNASRMSSEAGAVLDMDLEANNFAVAPQAECASHHFANVKTTPQNELSNSRMGHVDSSIATKEHLQMPEVEKNSDKPEQSPFLSFPDYWSDPCFEFAFKTLTGAIPVEDSLQNQSYFQQQVDTSQIQQHYISQTPRDVSPSLPDFGLPDFFQTDISVHFDPPPEKQQPALQPQMPVNSHSFLSSGSMTLASCSSISSQPPPHVKENKGMRGEVKS